MDAEEYDVKNDPAARTKMERELGRVATPALVIDGRVMWGFEENRTKIAEALGIEGSADEH